MAEWLKAAVLKTVGRKPRGFESYSLRQILRSKIWRDLAPPPKKLWCNFGEADPPSHYIQFTSNRLNLERWPRWLKATAC
jgi:hypothetical protein